MPSWLTWLLAGLLLWALLSVPIALLAARFIRLSTSSLPEAEKESAAPAQAVARPNLIGARPSTRQKQRLTSRRA